MVGTDGNLALCYRGFMFEGGIGDWYEIKVVRLFCVNIK